jgi:hypothetical protein
LAKALEIDPKSKEISEALDSAKAERKNQDSGTRETEKIPEIDLKFDEIPKMRKPADADKKSRSPHPLVWTRSRRPSADWRSLQK